MTASTTNNTSKLKVADSYDTFHIVVPQRSKLASNFDEEIGGNQSDRSFLSGACAPFCRG